MTSQGQRFRRRALRRGYKVDEVDSFLDRVEATLNGDRVDAPVRSQEVRDVVFRVRFGGYDEWQVDLHLDRVERQLADQEPSQFAGERKLERAPERQPERMPERIPERLPERVPNPGPAAPMGAAAGMGAMGFDRGPERPGSGPGMNQTGPGGVHGPTAGVPSVGFAGLGSGSHQQDRPGSPYPQERPPAHPPERPAPMRDDRMMPSGGRPPAPQGPPVPQGPPAGWGEPPASPRPGFARPDYADDPYDNEPTFAGIDPRRVRPEMSAETRMPEPPAAYQPPAIPERMPDRLGGPQGPDRMGGPQGAPPAGPGMPAAGMPPVPPMGSGPMGAAPMGSGPMGGGPIGNVPIGAGPMGGGPMGGPAGPGGVPAGDVQRIDQLRRAFQQRRFGSGYDRQAVDRLFEGIIGAMSGRAPGPISDAELDPRQFDLVPGGYFESEVDQALREVRDIIRRR